MSVTASGKRPNPPKNMRREIPTIPELRKQAHDSLDSLMTAAVSDNHELYQLALMNLVDCISLIRFTEPTSIADFERTVRE